VPRHVSYVPLRWADMDAFGHVNNVVYLRYLQEARVDMLFVHAPEHGAEQLARGVVVRRHEIGYRAPLRFRPQPVRVETWVTEVRAASFGLGYEVLDIASDGSRTVYAVAASVLVPYDLEEERIRRIAPREREVLGSFLETDGPVPGRMGYGATRSPSEERARVRVRPSRLRHVYECAVRFDDLDSYGHVNNVTFAEYLQEARVDFAHRYLADALETHEGSVVAHQALDYLRPVSFRIDPLRVVVWVRRIGTSSFDVAYEVCDDDVVYVRATGALVAFDVAEHRPRPLTEAERAALTKFLEP
jgi:acyl-CoA thioester hydrolase